MSIMIENEEGLEIALPTRLEVCWSCDGHGTSTRYIEPEGGGFTGSEWAEACHDDPDFSQDYMNGHYDKPCPECKGRNVVEAVDREACSVELLTAWDAWCEAEAYHAAEQAAERRMGC